MITWKAKLLPRPQVSWAEIEKTGRWNTENKTKKRNKFSIKTQWQRQCLVMWGKNLHCSTTVTMKMKWSWFCLKSPGYEISHSLFRQHFRSKHLSFCHSNLLVFAWGKVNINELISFLFFFCIFSYTLNLDLNKKDNPRTRFQDVIPQRSRTITKRNHFRDKWIKGESF